MQCSETCDKEPTIEDKITEILHPEEVPEKEEEPSVHDIVEEILHPEPEVEEFDSEEEESEGEGTTTSHLSGIDLSQHAVVVPDVNLGASQVALLIEE